MCNNLFYSRHLHSNPDPTSCTGNRYLNITARITNFICPGNNFFYRRWIRLKSSAQAVLYIATIQTSTATAREIYEKTCYRHAEKRALEATKKRAMQVYDSWGSFIKVIQEWNYPVGIP